MRIRSYKSTPQAAGSSRKLKKKGKFGKCIHKLQEIHRARQQIQEENSYLEYCDLGGRRFGYLTNLLCAARCIVN